MDPEFTINAHTAYVTMRKALTRRIILVTAMPRETVEAMGMERAESPGAAMDLAREAAGAVDSVLVLPLASVTVPLARSGGR